MCRRPPSESVFECRCAYAVGRGQGLRTDDVDRAEAGVRLADGLPEVRIETGLAIVLPGLSSA